MMDDVFDITITEPGDVIKEFPSDVEIVIDTMETISTEEPETISEGAEPIVIELEPTIGPEVSVTKEPEPAEAPRKHRSLSPEEAQAIRVHYKD